MTMYLTVGGHEEGYIISVYSSVLAQLNGEKKLDSLIVPKNTNPHDIIDFIERIMIVGAEES